MAVVLDGIIKQEDLESAPRRVSFQELVGDNNRQHGETFVRFLPDGRLPALQGAAKEPEISPEELHQRRLETIERETYQKAFAAGEEAGLALGEQAMEQEIARLLPQFESVLHQLDALPRRVFASAERFLVETAILLTRELLAHELTVNPEGIVHRVRRLLDQAAGRRDIVLYLAPDSAAILQNVGGFEKLRIEADAAIAPGSVRMESDFGGIEENLERQLADVEAGLRSYLQDRLQNSGCEDIALSAKYSAERAAARNRELSPLVKKSPDREAFNPPVAPQESAPSSAVGLAEIAGALADAQEHEEAWPDAHSVASAQGGTAPWDETVMSRDAWAGQLGAGPEEEEEGDLSTEETVVSMTSYRQTPLSGGGRPEDEGPEDEGPIVDALETPPAADPMLDDDEIS
ncbi:MAG: hypothetical protein HQL88_02850 [Magnetococcales bacterium]|nr:hypothetical protein [Magnetococcales bacterium]